MARRQGEPVIFGTPPRRALATNVLCLAAAAFPAVGSAQFSDVPYVPTPRNVVEAMLELAKVGPDDYLIDLGSGDGRIVITAAKKHGTRGFGVDIDGALVNDAQREARRQGVSDKVSFHARNLFITDISSATVVTLYLFPAVNLRLRPRLLTELRPGTRIVSHEFDMAAWQPDATLTLAVPDKPHGAPSSDVFLWIVPADASGQWRWQLAVDGAVRRYELRLEQTFQLLQGESVVNGGAARFISGRVQGEGVSFALSVQSGGREVRQAFKGRISGDAIIGTAVLEGGQSAPVEWRAERSARGKFDINAAAPVARPILIAEEHP